MNTLTTTEPQNSAVAIIREALAAGATPETLRELLAVRREWEADEARKAFHLAVADFQRLAPIIEKGDSAHNKQYARMDRIWRAVRPITSDLGLSVTWQMCELRQGELCHVEGNLGHALGHSVKLVMDVPIPAAITGQNQAQRMGSAFTYAQRYAFCAALGIVTGDDDDGNSAGTTFSARERLKQMRSKQESGEPVKPVVTDVQETLDPDFEEFIAEINAAEDADALTALVPRGRAFTIDSQIKTARRAMENRATQLRVKWSKQSNSFTS
jgi:hypothetical protein